MITHPENLRQLLGIPLQKTMCIMTFKLLYYMLRMVNVSECLGDRVLTAAACARHDCCWSSHQAYCLDAPVTDAPFPNDARQGEPDCKR